MHGSGELSASIVSLLILILVVFVCIIFHLCITCFVAEKNVSYLILSTLTMKLSNILRMQIVYVNHFDLFHEIQSLFVTRLLITYTCTSPWPNLAPSDRKAPELNDVSKRLIYHCNKKAVYIRPTVGSQPSQNLRSDSRFRCYDWSIASPHYPFVQWASK